MTLIYWDFFSKIFHLISLKYLTTNNISKLRHCQLTNICMGLRSQSIWQMKFLRIPEFMTVQYWKVSNTRATTSRVFLGSPNSCKKQSQIFKSLTKTRIQIWDPKRSLATLQQLKMTQTNKLTHSSLLILIKVHLHHRRFHRLKILNKWSRTSDPRCNLITVMQEISILC